MDSPGVVLVNGASAAWVTGRCCLACTNTKSPGTFCAGLLLVSFWLQELWNTGRCDLVLRRAKMQCWHPIEKRCWNMPGSFVRSLSFFLVCCVNLHDFHVFHFSFMALMNTCLALLKKCFSQLLSISYKNSQTWRTTVWGSALWYAVKPAPTTCPGWGERPTLLAQVPAEANVLWLHSSNYNVQA